MEIELNMISNVYHLLNFVYFLNLCAMVSKTGANNELFEFSEDCSYKYTIFNQIIFQSSLNLRLQIYFDENYSSASANQFSEMKLLDRSLVSLY